MRRQRWPRRPRRRKACMKTKMRALGICFLLATFASAQTGKSAAASAFAGTWQGTSNGLPAIDLKIEGSASKLAGTAVFYLQARNDESEAWHVASQFSVQMLHPRVQGKNFYFEVPHHTCHGCSDYGPNVRLRMELAGQNEARLARFSDSGEQAENLQLVRKQ